MPESDTRKTWLLRRGLIVLALAACVFSCRGESPSAGSGKTSGGPAPPSSVQTAFEGETMGSSYHVAVAGVSLPPAEYDAVARKIRERLEQINIEMSTYRPDSELSHFNASDSAEPFSVSADTFEVAQKSVEIARLSEGAFDPTVRPLVELWGFGAAKAEVHAPSPKALRRAASLVDYRALILDPRTRTIRKKKPGISLDFGAIAPGFAADKIGETLSALGFENFMVEIGGEVMTKGRNRTGGFWRIGIDKPRLDTGPGEDLQIVIGLSGRAVSTSGDYRRYRVVDGRRVSHTIDPRLQGPITHNLASVSLVAGRCMDADGIATAVDVLGPEKGMALVKSLEGAEAYLIVRKDDGSFETSMTDGFSKLILP